MNWNFERVSWVGSILLIASGLPALYFLTTGVPATPSLELSNLQEMKSAAHLPLNIAIPLQSDLQAVPLGSAQEQVAFSTDPVRPDRKIDDTHFLLRLNPSKQTKRIELPTHIDLTFKNSGVLQFTETGSDFWLECKAAPENKIDASTFYRSPNGEIICQSQWISLPQETPLQSVEEFSEGDPFRELASAKWWGQDLLIEKIGSKGSVHRLEVGIPAKSEIIDCSVNDWLIFKDKKWQKLDSLENAEGLFLARIQTATSQSLEMEGWNDTSHLRFKLEMPPAAPLKVKADELFSQLRVRSEKQISCMIEKQCFVLRPGDWVLKTGSRWKILRKKEEKQSLLDGKLTGDLFLLERIDAKGATKSITGQYFSVSRTQSVPIEYSQKAQKMRRRGR